MQFSIREALEKMQVKLILCDLDDTLVHTNRIFLKQIELFCAAVHMAIPSISQRELRAEVERLNQEIYLTHSIAKSNWALIAQRLTAKYGDTSRDVIFNSLSFMMKIYEQVPDLREGALEFLQAIKDSGIPLSIITHASQEWTDIKMTAHNLHFYTTQLHVVPEDEHKASAHWTQAMQLLHVAPHEVIAIGDSILTDIWPAHESGIRKIIWVDKPDGWSLYRNGTLPLGTHIINELPEVIPLLCTTPWI